MFFENLEDKNVLELNCCFLNIHITSIIQVPLDTIRIKLILLDIFRYTKSMLINKK